MKTPRKVELPTTESTRMCGPPSHPKAEPGCADYLWKQEVPYKGAEGQPNQSSDLPLEQDVPEHPASQRGATSLQTQEVTHRTEITVPSRAGAANPAWESKCTDATRYRYLYIRCH